MKMEIGLLESASDSEWDGYVKNNPDATFYHQTGWKNVIEKAYGHKPLYFVAWNGLGKISGVLPLFCMNTVFKKRLISLPFAPYGGVCCDDTTIEKAMVDHVIAMSREQSISSFELRNLSHDISYPFFTTISDYYSTFILDLEPDSDLLWKGLGKNVKGGIKKGANSGLSFDVDHGRDAITNFHSVYARTMSRLGSPSHSLSFFQQIEKEFPGQVLVSIVKHDGDLVATLLLLKFGSTLISGWGASLEKYFKYSPNNFIYWKSIEFARDNNFKYFDFGRSAINTGNYNFKRFWGAKNVPMSYCYYPAGEKMPLTGSQFTLFPKIWKNIPFSVARVIGPLVRKNIP